MRTFAAGREINIPTDNDGYVDIPTLRQSLGVPPDRALIQQEPSGENTVLPTRGEIQLHPYSHFLDAPRARRG